MSNIYFHIGNPKAYSTSIQKMLFDNQHLGYKYFGFSPSLEYKNWFQNELVARFLDRDLRFTSEIAFNKLELDYKSFFQKEFAKCKTLGQDLWISSECAGLRYLIEDSDLSLKFNRIQRTMPHGTNFIIIFRNIFDSIKSIYAEYVKQRYGKSFKVFCEELYLYRDSNFLFSLLPGHQTSYLSNLLTNNNKLKCLFIDNEDKNGSNLINELNKLCNYNFDELPKFNDSKKRTSTGTRLELNQITRYPIDTTGMIETHRGFSYFNDENREIYEDHVWSKLRQQRDSDSGVSDEKNINFDFKGPLFEYLEEIKKEDFKLFRKFTNSDIQQSLFEKTWSFSK